MAGSPEIHTSELKSFKRCRRKWAIGELAALQPLKKNMNFMLGTAVHAGLEEWSKSGDIDKMVAAYHQAIEDDIRGLREDMPWLYAEQEADIIENTELGLVMLNGYAEEYANDTFRAVKAGGSFLLEVQFAVPILTPEGKPYKKYMYGGIMDGVGLDDYGYWILERKTTTRTSPDYLRLDDQNVMYLAYAQQKWPKIKPHLRGVLYDFLRKQKPGPRVKSPLFFRERIYRNQHEIDSAMEHVFWVVKDMERVAKDPDRLAYPTPSENCSWDCSYKQICQAMNDGTDVDTIIEAGFVKLEEGRNGWVSDWMPKSRG